MSKSITAETDQLPYPGVKTPNIPGAIAMQCADVEAFIRQWLMKAERHNWTNQPTNGQRSLIYKVTTSRAAALYTRTNRGGALSQRKDAAEFASALSVINRLGPNFSAALEALTPRYRAQEDDREALEGLRKAAKWLGDSPTFIPYRGSLDFRSASHEAETLMLEAVEALLSSLHISASMTTPTGRGVTLAHMMLTRDPKKPDQDKDCPSPEALVKRWKRRKYQPEK